MKTLLSWYEDLLFKLRLTWKRLMCKHDDKYEGVHLGYHTHRCVKCNRVLQEKQINL